MQQQPETERREAEYRDPAIETESEGTEPAPREQANQPNPPITLQEFFFRYRKRFGVVLGGWAHLKEKEGILSGYESDWIAEVEAYRTRRG